MSWVIQWLLAQLDESRLGAVQTCVLEPCPDDCVLATIDLLIPYKFLLPITSPRTHGRPSSMGTINAMDIQLSGGNGTRALLFSFQLGTARLLCLSE